MVLFELDCSWTAGNILVHRDYSSYFPTKIIITQGWLTSKNWCIPRRHGLLMIDELKPYPKNPLIQQFFNNIRRTDSIGSGVKSCINTFQYIHRRENLLYLRTSF